MNTKIFFIAFTVFLGFTQVAKSGVILFVHFGDYAPNVIDQQDLVTTLPPNTLPPNGGSNSVTASIYLNLTDNSSLYGYRFSIRYDSGALDFNGRSQADFLFNRDTFVENLGAEPGPVKASKATSLVENGKDLYRFNGLTSGLVAFRGTGFYKLATVTFTLVDPQQDLQGKKLIEAGKFEFSPNDVELRDGVLTDDKVSNGDPKLYDFNGGFSNPSTVPEPASALVFVALGTLVLLRRKRSLSAKNHP